MLTLQRVEKVRGNGGYVRDVRQEGGVDVSEIDIGYKPYTDKRVWVLYVPNKKAGLKFRCVEGELLLFKS